MKTELRFTIVCHCPDAVSITHVMDCFTEVVEAFNLEVLHSADCKLIRLEDDSNGC